jgi:hypothetical protein
MFTYSPPGNLDDLAGRPARAALLTDWHDFILQNFRDNIGGLGSSPMFFTEADTPAAIGPVAIPWNAFPLMISRQLGGGPRAWAAADVLQSTTRYTPDHAPKVTTQFRPQDEYCEWFAYKDPATGKLSRIVFTSEGPEYWSHLAAADLDFVVGLYHQFVDPSVQKADLLLTTDLQMDDGSVLRAGTYDPFNIWNTQKGVMHLTHPANTLGAEINLAAFATLTRKDNTGARVTDVRRLVCCAGYGVANRSSDPSIGWNVNTTCVPLAAGSSAVDATLANPVALYMNGLQAGALTGPAGEALDQWFQFKRGTAGMGLLAILEPPQGAPFGLDQVSVKGVPLQFGGQVAESIDMVLYAKAKPRTGVAQALVACSSHCCMPAGTPPAKLPSINLTQPQVGADPCSSGQMDAYPEIFPPPGAHAAAAPHPLTAAVRRSVPHARSRRAE